MRTRWMISALVLTPLTGAWAQAEGESEEGRSGAAACVERARNETRLSEHESVLLCQGAASTEPVTCFLDASENTFMEQQQILRLCSPTLSGRVWAPTP